MRTDVQSFAAAACDRPAGIEPEDLLLTVSDGGRDFPVRRRPIGERRSNGRAQFPGVHGRGLTSRPPIHGARGQAFLVDGRADIAGNDNEARAGDILISGDYFRTMGMHVVKGRTFTDHDDATAPAPVAIVSQSLRAALFP